MTNQKTPLEAHAVYGREDVTDAEIGIIGGSGLYSLLDRPKKVRVNTRFGYPSDAVSIGMLGEKRVAFLPRHGSRHTIPPHRIPYKANIEAFGKLGVRRIITTNAVGSLNPNYKIGDFAIFDQFVNMTCGRDDTFFHEGKVVHVSAAEPYCSELRSVASKSAKKHGIRSHDRCTVLVINGPRFSTKAESRHFSASGFDVINMTQYPEIILAREREMCYLGIGIVTDYDAGLEGRKDVKAVSYDDVKRSFAESISRIMPLVTDIVSKTSSERKCECGSALEGAVVGV